MSVQTTYKFGTTHGAAGGIFDLAPYQIDTYLNGEETGVMKFGLGVVDDAENAGKAVVLPTSADGVFEGVTVNNRSTEYDMDGKIRLVGNKALGVMRYGKVYVALATDATPEFGDAVYLVVSGTEKGYFTDSNSGTMAINARFMSGADNGVAMIELQQGNVAGGGSAYELPKASADVLGGVKIGTGLTVDADGKLSVAG